MQALFLCMLAIPVTYFLYSSQQESPPLAKKHFPEKFMPPLASTGSLFRHSCSYRLSRHTLGTLTDSLITSGMFHRKSQTVIPQ